MDEIRKRILNEKNTYRGRVIRWVAPDEYFEGELWLPGRFKYTDLDRLDFPPCKCKRTESDHDSMSLKDYWLHRKRVNHYRRRYMNLLAKRRLGQDTCPWRGIAI